VDETLKASHTSRLVSKIGWGTVWDTVSLDIYVKVLYIETITRFLYM